MGERFDKDRHSYTLLPNFMAKDKLATLSGSAVKLYVALAARRNSKDQRIFPTHETLRRDTGLSANTIDKAARELRCQGLVTWTKTRGPNLYVLQATPKNGVSATPKSGVSATPKNGVQNKTESNETKSNKHVGVDDAESVRSVLESYGIKGPKLNTLEQLPWMSIQRVRRAAEIVHARGANRPQGAMVCLLEDEYAITIEPPAAEERMDALPPTLLAALHQEAAGGTYPHTNGLPITDPLCRRMMLELATKGGHL